MCELVRRKNALPIATSVSLIVADYKDANHCYWRLTDAGGSSWLIRKST